jgi:hypothetical protein
MCFVHDYDWNADVYEDEIETLTQKRRCCECRFVIQVGEEAGYVYAQEREACDECDCCMDARLVDQGERCDCGQCPDGCQLGESSEEWTCRKCIVLRAAIRQVEESVGCRGMEAEPGIGRMHDDVSFGEGWEHFRAEFRRLGLIEAQEYSSLFDLWQCEGTRRMEEAAEECEQCSGAEDYYFYSWRDVHEFDDLGGEG